MRYLPRCMAYVRSCHRHESLLVIFKNCQKVCEYTAFSFNLAKFGGRFKKS